MKIKELVDEKLPEEQSRRRFLNDFPEYKLLYDTDIDVVAGSVITDVIRLASKYYN